MTADLLSEKARALAVTFGSYLYDRGLLIHSGDEQKLTELIEAALREAAEDKWNHVHSYPEHDSFHEYGDCGGNHVEGCGFRRKKP